MKEKKSKSKVDALSLETEDKLDASPRPSELVPNHEMIKS